MGGWGPIIAAGLLAGTALHARAQDASSRCGSQIVSTGRVTSIIDGRSFVLDDGREIRLAALEVPLDAASPAGQAARAALTALLAGATVALRGAPATDRYGRAVAFAFTTGERKSHSVTHEMLAQGHARVGTQIGDPACAAELLSRERVARIGKLGLWGDPRYALLEAGDLTGLVAGQGRFAVVEGKVLSVRERGDTIYVNFGRRWSQALTVTISKRQQRIFAGAGLAPKTLENRRVRARGWVEIRNGPRIEASRPEQIEIAELN
jgi:endonuclease YncB( thermonuclease family)